MTVDLPRNTCHQIVIDIDETLLNPLAKYHAVLSDRLGLHFSVAQVERSGGLNSLFSSHPRYPEIRQFIDSLRADTDFNSNLPAIEGSVEGVRRLLELPSLFIGAYLTARPPEVIQATEENLFANGFPSARVLAKPRSIPRERTTAWKLSILETIRMAHSGTLLVVDDAVPLALAIRDWNRSAQSIIIPILFLGPLTADRAAREDLRSDPTHHFYVSGWDGIPGICASYAGTACDKQTIELFPRQDS